MSDFIMTELYAEIDDLNDRNSELEQQVRSISLTRDELVRERDELVRERDELAAHVERCNADTDKAIELLSLIRDGGFNLDELEGPVHDFLINYRFAGSPKTSLAEQDAGVVENFAESIVNGEHTPYVQIEDGHYYYCGSYIQQAAQQYANKIRNAKDGE